MAKDNKPNQKTGVTALFVNEVKELFKHPIKLLPTIILSVIWIVLPMVLGFVKGANIPVVRFFSTLTYANGGIFGGFFGTVGGIFGKAVFAAVVNGFILSLCAKKNPFSGIKKGFSGVLGGGIKAVSPFLIGGGVGFLLYFFFNITSAPQNSAIAIVCAVSALQTVAKQNGVVFGIIFFAAKKLSKGKAPSRASVGRVLSGLAAAFAISFPVTFLRYRFLTAIIGLFLLLCGILLPFVLSTVGKNAPEEKPDVSR